MTTSTTKDPREVAIELPMEPPNARKTQPGLGVPPASSDADLETRINLRRVELIGRLGEIRGATHLAATEARDLLKASLSELAHIIKMGVVDGWASIGDPAKQKLEHWIVTSGRLLAAQDLASKVGQS